MKGTGLLEKIIRFQSLRWDNGKLSLWNIPGFFHAVYVNVYQQRLMEKLYGERAAADFFYNVGKFQGIQGFRTLTKNFGFDKIIKDKKSLLEMETQQGSLVGLGDFHWVRTDFSSQFFVIKGSSVFADEYKQFFRLQKHPVCHLLSGIGAGFLSELLQIPTVSVEHKCMAMGDHFCEFDIRPQPHTHPNDQKAAKFLSMRSLGAQHEPYMRVP